MASGTIFLRLEIPPRIPALRVTLLHYERNRPVLGLPRSRPRPSSLTSFLNFAHFSEATSLLTTSLLRSVTSLHGIWPSFVCRFSRAIAEFFRSKNDLRSFPLAFPRSIFLVFRLLAYLLGFSEFWRRTLSKVSRFLRFGDPCFFFRKSLPKFCLPYLILLRRWVSVLAVRIVYYFHCQKMSRNQPCGIFFPLLVPRVNWSSAYYSPGVLITYLRFVFWYFFLFCQVKRSASLSRIFFPSLLTFGDVPVHFPDCLATSCLGYILPPISYSAKAVSVCFGSEDFLLFNQQRMLLNLPKLSLQLAQAP